MREKKVVRGREVRCKGKMGLVMEENGAMRGERGEIAEMGLRGQWGMRENGRGGAMRRVEERCEGRERGESCEGRTGL